MGPCHQKIVIIGNGISGITAARFIRKLSNHEIYVISAETDYFFSRTALMYIYMGHMKYEHTKPYEDFFWKKNRINLLRAKVKTIDFKNKNIIFDPEFEEGNSAHLFNDFNYDQLIIATGSQTAFYNWPGQQLKGVRGLYSFQDLQYMEKHTNNIKNAVVVGGGLIGIEMAEMLKSRNIPTTFLVRESQFYNETLPEEEAKMIGNHILEHGVDLRLNTELQEIVGDENNGCKKVITNQKEHIDCDFVGIATGVKPNVAFLKNSELELNRGILVDEYLRTNIKDVYAIGDCAEIKLPSEGRRPIEPIWYTGRIMGETVAHTLCGLAEKYNPGIWFNSAKFFDIEYQTYGHIPTKIDEGYESLIWQDRENKKLIRINYRKSDQAVCGFNLLGVRMRQEVCQKWIKEETTIEQVLINLGAASFDIEFSFQYENKFIENYRASTGIQLTTEKRRGWKSAFQFLSK
jgi:NAD(P)H-nitrite reductase large subunit